MKLKKIPRKSAVLILTLGASITLGFLSFTGMFAIWPIIPLALAAFILAVAYDSEIFSRNISHSLDKLTKKDYLKRRLAKDFLLTHFPKDTNGPNVPQYFRDYELLLQQLHTVKNHKQKRKLDKSLKALEKQFASWLFKKDDETADGPLEEELRTWLKSKELEKIHALYAKRRRQFRIILLISAITSVSMAIGTALLIAESIMIIPAVAALLAAPWAIPLLILIGAGVISAGLAYALMTYNAMTDILLNDVLGKWFKNLTAVYYEGIHLESVLLSTGALAVIGLALVLTVCTAGTWWTIGRHAIPFLPAISKLPGIIVMRFINPVVLGVAALAFNLANTRETFDFLIDWAKHLGKNTFGIFKNLKAAWGKIRENENWGQILNPFRLLLILTITPLRCLLFVGHLISMAVTGDRLPGIPEIITALVGFICEFFEDLHYFFGHEHSHDHHKMPSTSKLLDHRIGSHAGHDHSNDVPTRILKIVFSPLYMLSIGWDWIFGQFNAKPKTFAKACQKQHLFIYDYEENLIDLGLIPDAPETVLEKSISAEGNNAIVAYKIDSYQDKHFGGLTLFGRDSAKGKKALLTSLATTLQKSDNPEETLEECKNNPMVGRHRLFTSGPTATSKFLDGLVREHYHVKTA